MTNKEQNKIAATIVCYFKDIGDNISPEQTANAGIDLVKMLIDDFPEIADKVDDVLTEDPKGWDALIHFLKMRKGE